MITSLQKILGAIILMLLYGHQCFSSFMLFGMPIGALLYLAFLLIFYYLIYLLEIGEYYLPNKWIKTCWLVSRSFFTLIAFAILSREECEIPGNHSSHILFAIDLFKVIKIIVVLIPEIILKVVFGMRKSLPVPVILIPTTTGHSLNTDNSSLSHHPKRG